MSKEILPSATTKNTGPDLYFFFGRVATHDSGRVCQTVTLPGAIMKFLFFFGLVLHVPDGLSMIEKEPSHASECIILGASECTLRWE